MLRIRDICASFDYVRHAILNIIEGKEQRDKMVDKISDLRSRLSSHMFTIVTHLTSYVARYSVCTIMTNDHFKF